MSSEVDLSRLEELRDLLQADLSELVNHLLRRLSDALTTVDAALAAENLPAVADAAHAARNEALMLGAGRLLKALEGVELNARDRHCRAAEAAQARVNLIWPEVRHALRRAAGG